VKLLCGIETDITFVAHWIGANLFNVSLRGLLMALKVAHTSFAEIQEKMCFTKEIVMVMQRIIAWNKMHAKALYCAMMDGADSFLSCKYFTSFLQIMHIYSSCMLTLHSDMIHSLRNIERLVGSFG
jgi:hypothetical protein